MALKRCTECGKDVSTNAAACPHCGNPVGSPAIVHIESTSTKKKMGCGSTIVLIIGLIFFFWMISGSKESPSDANISKEQKEKEMDSDSSPLSSCDWHDMEKQGLNILAWTDEAIVCSTMKATMGRMPSLSLARGLSKVIFVMHGQGKESEPKDIAYQIMMVVEARGKEKDDKAIYSTFDTVFKIFNGSEGHVAPKDLNVFLRNSGPMAKTISDEGLMSMAALIWEDKKKRGE